VPARARAGPNSAGLVPAHLTRAKFSGLREHMLQLLNKQL
jgi:hypothetical protein